MTTKGWLYQYKNPDPYRWFARVYLKEAAAYLDAVQSIKGWAEEEIQNLAGEEQYEAAVEDLKVVVSLIAEGKNEEAFSEWRTYAEDAEPQEDIQIEEIDVVE